MVLSYNRRKRAHKLIYMEDESVEVVELGNGAHQRKWKTHPLPADPLVGKIITLEKEPSEDEEWFEDMRAPKDRHAPGLNVLVVSKYEEMPDEEEISHPIPPDLHTRTDQRWYRIINVTNDYLATVDLGYVPYTLDADHNHLETTRSKGNPILPIDSRRPSRETSRQAGAAGKYDDPDAKDDEYIPEDDEVRAEQKDDQVVDFDDDDQVRPNAEDKVEPVVAVTAAAGAGASADARRAKRSGKSARKDAAQEEIDRDPTNVTDDEDDGSDHVDDAEPEDEIKADDMIRALDDDDDEVGRVEPRGRAKGEGSAATQETHDDPLEPNGTTKRGKGKGSKGAGSSSFPRMFDDDADAHTASDEEKLGWVSAKKEQPSRSQVGDYISLDLGNGQGVRKAFVEAYMPEADKHFLAFCDAEGGNLQIKLTGENHTVLKDDEVDELNRAQMLDSAGQATGAGSAVRSNKRRRQAVNLSEPKSRKKRDVKTPPIRGERAGSEVCGRCLKIVWPGSDMVYTALVMGYNKERDEHQVVYLSDQCVETMELKYREWNLLAREDEPWITQGMLGKRLYVYWEGEYQSEKDQEKAKEIFGEETKVAYEAFVLSYEGDGSYMIIYPNSEDKEVRDLRKDEVGDADGKGKDWGILKEGVSEVNGLPVVGWEP